VNHKNSYFSKADTTIDNSTSMMINSVTENDLSRFSMTTDGTNVFEMNVGQSLVVTGALSNGMKHIQNFFCNILNNIP
jgi:hypothetical protein